MATVHLPWWCDWSEVFAHGLDNPSTPDPETHTDPNTSVKQQPDRSWCFLHYTTLLVDKPECNKGTNCIAGETEEHHPSYKNFRKIALKEVFYFPCGFSLPALTWPSRQHPFSLGKAATGDSYHVAFSLVTSSPITRVNAERNFSFTNRFLKYQSVIPHYVCSETKFSIFSTALNQSKRSLQFKY